MKINEPVTGNEIPFPESGILVSQTDLRGVITYANQAFVDISGFSRSELIGQSHNVVRHPDMPPQAFGDLWRTVKAGRPWTGLVKNRARNGDHYWVKANVTPLREGGRVTGYLSVRTRPERHEVDAAEVLYAAVRRGDGRLGPAGPIRWLRPLATLRIRTLLAGTVFATLGVLGAVAALVAARAHPHYIYALLGFTGLTTLVLGLSLTAYVTRPLAYARRKLEQVAEGNYFDWVDTRRRDEVGELLQAIKATQIKLGFEVMDARERADAATRLKTALDCVSTNVMVADKELNIIYANPAAQRMFREAAADLRERLPAFDPDRLVGNNIDRFHRHPEHQRRLLAALGQTHVSQLTVGPRTFRIIANPVVGADGERLGTAVEWADLTHELEAQDQDRRRLEAEREHARENLRIRTALDHVSSSVMMADREHRIVYMNRRMRELFQEAEADIRADLPDFRADALEGSSIERFHRDRAGEGATLDALRQAEDRQIDLGRRSFRLVANVVVTGDGERLGTAVEWTDRTAEVAVENEVEGIVAAARSGDLGRRIHLDDKRGFFRHLGAGINALLDEVSNVFDDIAAVMSAMSEGDLSRAIRRDYQGTFGKVRADVNETLTHLADMVERLRESADAISTASSEISTGNTNLSARTEQQAASLQETASSMEELTSTVRNNADNAQQGNQLAGSARALAERGGSVVSSAVQAMEAIDTASRRIAEIIGVIDEIAFQTNLLALNASVEAARAGEQGRGFAVVATEVRNLASRSAAAAKEIKTLIRDSGEKVRVGAELVNESGVTLTEIVTAVKRVGDIVAEIAAASAEQAAGIDQVNQAVTSMDELTQQNAALAEQTSAASASLYEKAQEMDELMRFFTLGDRPDSGEAA